MIDLALDENHDVGLSGGDLTLIRDGLEVAQSGKIRLLTIVGEWFLDVTLGLDWLDKTGRGLFSVASSLEMKEAEIKRIIRGTPGVEDLESFVFGVNPFQRVATVEFRALTVYGSIEVGI